jgi:pimeloyl-ACP methyl ester carboxylesterase
MNTENVLKLSDGMRIGYAEYGNPNGFPVFLFHGNPGSRLCWGLMPGSPFLPNIRIIAPDRPGYGLTDLKKKALENWPYDIIELADHLKIDKFSVFAPSGGGPYALACAWKIPERLASVGIFGSVGPNIPEATTGAIRSLKLLWKISNPLYGLVKLQMRVMAYLFRKNPEKFLLRLRDLELSEWDKKVFDRPEIRNIFRKDFPEAYRQNGMGSAYDTTIPANWPILLEQIKMKVHLWHAKPDALTGNMSEYISEQLPNSELRVIPDAGHLWILDHVGDVLEIIIPT